MMPTNETVLSTIVGATDDERLLVVLVHSSAYGSRLELKQQSWGDGVGWFTQSRVEIQPDQVADLRSALGAGGCTPTRQFDRPNLQLHRFQAESA